MKLFDINIVKYGSNDMTKITSPVIAITLALIFLIISKIMWKKYQLVNTTIKLVKYAKKLVFKAQKPARVIVSGCGSSSTMTVRIIARTASANASSFSESIIYYFPHFFILWYMFLLLKGYMVILELLLYFYSIFSKSIFHERHI